MKNIVNWFAENPIAANLIMLMILVGGATGLDKIEKEVQPNFKLNQVNVTIPYRGAGPKEIEQQICLRVEEAIDNLQGVKEITCISQEGVAIARVEGEADYPINRLLNEVKSRIDAVSTFPVDAERPIIEQLQFKIQVLNVAVIGPENADEKTLKEFSIKLKNDMLLQPNIPDIGIQGVRDYEISIEVNEFQLRKYNLTLSDISRAIARTSINLGGGIIRSASGEIQIQARNLSLSRQDFENIPVIALVSGATLKVADIATVRDGFVDSEVITQIDGRPANLLTVYMNEKPDVLKVSKAAKDYIQQVRPTLPAGYELQIWQDSSQYFNSRLGTLVRNGTSGLILVFIILLLFLRPALALWVSVGIAVSFIGSLLVLPMVGTSVNILTLFAYIMVLGIVVDDAIIVGESIYQQQQKGIHGVNSAKIGAGLVVKPVFFAVFTSIIVFIPLLLLSGEWAYFMAPIATIPILVLLFSLLESCFILPAHLAYLKPEPKKPFFAKFTKLRNNIDRGLKIFLVIHYLPFLKKCLNNRSATVASFIGFCMISISLVAGGWVKVALPPDVAFDFIQVDINFPEGIAHSAIKDTSNRIEAAVASADAEYAVTDSIVKSVFIYGGGNRIFTLIELVPDKQRNVATREFSKKFQELLGNVEQAEQINTVDKVTFESADLTLRLYGPEAEYLDTAATWLKRELATIDGFNNINDNILAGRTELNLQAKAGAYNIGLPVSEIARQVRQFFYGEEVQRVPRGTEDIRVMVRYPKAVREDITALQELRIRTQDNRQIPIDTVADVSFQDGFAKIIRVDGRASIDVNANYDNESVALTEAIATLKKQLLPKFYQQFPDVTIDMKGEQEEVGSFVNDLTRLGLLAILVIYGLLSIQFRSIYQPLIILSAIPVSLAGITWPHLFSGNNISLMSVLGMLAASGVIINDTIVLLDSINRKRATNLNLKLIMMRAAKSRFRPIFLTSMTTFFGLVPIMLETSLQAKFLIPMAMALAYGILFASLVTLVLVPCLYTIGYQFKNGLKPFYKKHFLLASAGQQKLWVSVIGYGPLAVITAVIVGALSAFFVKLALSFINLPNIQVAYFGQMLQFLAIAAALLFWSVSIWKCSDNTASNLTVTRVSVKVLAIVIIAAVGYGFLYALKLL